MVPEGPRYADYVPEAATALSHSATAFTAPLHFLSLLYTSSCINFHIIRPPCSFPSNAGYDLQSYIQCWPVFL
jgi:hypothetical protein